MKRRAFSQATLAAASLGALSSVARMAQAQAGSGTRRGSDGGGASMGTNLSGMEWARPGLRHSLSSEPNIHFTVPRAADIAYLAANGFQKNRLPIQWELLQPMLAGTEANAAARAAIGEPGAFHAVYEAYITGVLDAHAAVGATCILDNHNYCRYRDFHYQPDGSVKGLALPPNPLLRPYTRDKDQIRTRIFALAPGATLTLGHFTDFWQRAARKWAKHPGFGGYGLMNEPHDMPKPGGLTASDEDGAKGQEDLRIWPAYAQAAIQAIRAIDGQGLIYVGGNQYSSAMGLASKNPGFPLAGNNLVYEVHMYLDAFSNGASFDMATEVAKNMSAGMGRGPINRSTGIDRLRMATDWARQHNVNLALTEIGMPIDDARWQEMFKLAAQHARETNCEIYTWMGGNHWPIRNYPINQVPGWHQNKTLEPLVAGVLKEVAGMDDAVLFDDGPGHALAAGAPGEPVTISVYARGNLTAPVTLKVSTDGRGKLSTTELTLAAGANSLGRYTYMPAANEVARLSYAAAGKPRQVPPARKVYSIADAAAHADKSLADAALSLLAKYSACKWDMADAHTDYVLGAPAAEGQAIRAIGDSGYGSSPGNAMEMLNWFNADSSAMGKVQLPVLRLIKGRKASSHSQANSGFWCKKRVPTPRLQPNPVNRMPYDMDSSYFVVAAISSDDALASGVVFEASRTEDAYFCELGLQNGRPRAAWKDKAGQSVELLADKKLAQAAPAVLSLTCAPGLQTLRVDGVEAGQASASFAPSFFSQMLIGWGFPNHYPRKGFGGAVFAVVTGRGSPTPGELAVIERYLAGSGRSA